MCRQYLWLFIPQALTAEESSSSDEDNEIQHQNKLRRRISSRVAAKSRSDVTSHPLASTHIVRQRLEEEEKLKAARLLLDDHCRKVSLLHIIVEVCLGVQKSEDVHCCSRLWSTNYLGLVRFVLVLLLFSVSRLQEAAILPSPFDYATNRAAFMVRFAPTSMSGSMRIIC